MAVYGMNTTSQARSEQYIPVNIILACCYRDIVQLHTEFQMLQVARVDTFLAAVLSDQETFSLLLPLEPPSSSSSSPSSANSAAPDTETCAKTPLLGVGTPRSNPSSIGAQSLGRAFLNLSPSLRPSTFCFNPASCRPCACEANFKQPRCYRYWGMQCHLVPFVSW